MHPRVDDETAALCTIETPVKDAALASVVNVIDPDVIVLGGGLSNLTDLPERLAAAMAPHVFSDVIGARVVRNLHGDSSGVRGAAWLWDEQETPR